ncbi:TRAP transporter substrate-binding protein [uncultured Cohaesibacter sp.]|uniref:TRAP transporter substrate-binding protein n=1 Tax=uncultured Cohaesibacter sp. TaxID=1002546 RepID=UPI0029C7BE6F|nr:TRAP transporter substrate-binding protein [uncultured Cohaesibacter sp.]
MFKKSAIILATTLSLALCAGVQAKTVIKLGHGTNEQFHMHRAMVKFKELVETGSNGEMEVELFPNSQMGPDREMIESVQSGILEMAVSPSALYSGWDPAFAIFELPYMYPSKQVALKTMKSETGQAMLARLEKQGLVGLDFLESGLRNITNNVREIRTPDDLKGIKLRTMKVPAHVDAFKALGANPTPMNFGEVYSAMQQGVIDGQENPLSIITSQRFYEVQKYLSLTGHVFTVYVPVISKAFMDGLTAEQQQLIRDSMDKAADYQQTIIAKEEAEQLKTIEDAGVKITRLSPEEMALFTEKTKDVRAKFRDEIGADVYDAWVSAIKAASAE